MRYCWLVLVLFCSLALLQTSVFGQAAVMSGSTNKWTLVPPPGSDVAPDAAVITIEGFCDSAAEAKSAEAGSQTTAESASTSTPTPTSSNCKTIVTREQFEGIITAIGSKMSPETKLKFAERYPELLLFAQQARQLGLEKDPKFGQLVRFGYNQVLAQTFSKYLRERDVTDAEVEKYYKEHPESFEEVDLQRIVIPDAKEHPPAPGSKVEPKVDKAADAAAMKLEAEKIHTQAVAGTGFQKLEEEVYQVVGDPDDVPDPALGKMSLDDVPKQYQTAVSALQPGKVSEVIAEENGWTILKLISRRTIPLGEAKPVARRRLFKITMDSLKESIKPQFNDAYFKASASPGQTPPGGGQVQAQPHP